ncbi:MAG: alcohol dehydrogenase catalytic domain-containing protein [Egibacteraceae bacterium]
MSLSLELYRSRSRYLAAKAVGGRIPGALAGPIAPLRLVNRDEPRTPAAGWVRVRPRLAGICGSDLATLSGQSSFYFSPLVSMPFVPGHEVVGELLDDVAPAPDPGPDAPASRRDGLAAGTRVVLDPVLSCGARGVGPCRWCAEGQRSRCDRVTVGHVSPGLQTGYCADTGGGWGRRLVAHRDQLHAIPDTLPDKRAVLVEPLACAVHSVRRAGIEPGQSVVVVGAGTVGLFTLLALRSLTQAASVTVVAKHDRQRELAAAFGATDVVAPDRAVKALRRSSRAFLLHPERGTDFLLGGVDVAFEATGGSSGLDLALRTVRAGGRVVLAGLPSARADLTPVWYRELELVGAYASGQSPERVSDFDTAIAMATEAPLDGVVSATYPLQRWREAIDHAFAAGRLGALKVTFAPQEE